MCFNHIYDRCSSVHYNVIYRGFASKLFGKKNSDKKEKTPQKSETPAKVEEPNREEQGEDSEPEPETKPTPESMIQA